MLKKVNARDQHAQTSVYPLTALVACPKVRSEPPAAAVALSTARSHLARAKALPKAIAGSADEKKDCIHRCHHTQP